MRLISRTDNRPYMNVIFGNFYSPAYDDREFVDGTMALIKRLGFNSVMFDTKASEDFRERYEGGGASQFVGMQEYMMESARRHGLAYNFLLLYMSGDNLYPHIRFSPPILGEGTVYLDGTPGNWYKYWSKKARSAMKAHVDRIMERYGGGCERCVLERDAGGDEQCEPGLDAGRDERCEPGQDVDGCRWREQGPDMDGCGRLLAERATEDVSGAREVIPVCSMWDPVVSPSFDEEGRTRYLSYLEEQYHGDLAELNRLYGTDAASFEELCPEEYWYGVRYGAESFYTEADVENRTPRFYVWRDNAFWKMEELRRYFEQISPMLKENNPDLFLCPDMSQWGYFLNIYGRSQQDLDNEFSDLWDTAMRGIDIYALSPYVDSCHFITVPVTPDGYPDAYVVSCQHSMMRVMNEGKPLTGGIYWGRYLYNDIYALLSPAEIIGSMTACGMDGYTCYGMNGLDDGGVMNRMEESFLESLRLANAWCSEVIGLRQGGKRKEIAILFPSEMALLEPFEVGNNKIRRLDLLGWYKLCCDLGYQTDVISRHEIERSALANYKVLIVPANDCYFAAEHEKMERKIAAWTAVGGVVIHGPGDLLAENCFGIRGEPCPKKPYRYGKTIIAQGERFCRYDGGTEIAPYVDGQGCCVAAYTGAELGRRLKWIDGIADGGNTGTEYEMQTGTGRDKQTGEAIEDRHTDRTRYEKQTETGRERRTEEAIEDRHADRTGHEKRAGKAGDADRQARGAVYSFGVQIGASYAAKNIPHVPYEQGNKEMYPIIQSQTTLIRDILIRHIRPASGICERGIETGVFDNGMVIVNHRSTPYILPRQYRTEKYQYPFRARQDGRGVLGGHEAVWVSDC